MKNTIIALCLAAVVTGCASGPVYGPFTYMNAKANKVTLQQRQLQMNRTQMQKSVMAAGMPAEKTAQAMTMIRLGATESEVQASVGIKVPLGFFTGKGRETAASTAPRPKLTLGEKTKHVGAMVLDGVIIGLAVDKGPDAIDRLRGKSGSDDEPQSTGNGQVIIYGDNNAPVNNNTIVGDDNDSNQDDNGIGTSNKDTEIKEEEEKEPEE